MIDIARTFFRDLTTVSGYANDIYDAECPFQVEPREFLEYAESDLKSSASHANVNSLTNTKRALDSQLDFFFDVYGLGNASTRMKWSTAKKIEIIGDIGGVPKGILHRINQARNDLEHRYEPPTRMTAENAIDIVSLFIDATDFYLYPVRYQSIYKNASDETSLILEVWRTDGLIRAGFTPKVDADELDEWNDLGFEVATEDLSGYLYLLTFVLHSNRLQTKNAVRYFDRLKYVKQLMQNGN